MDGVIRKRAEEIQAEHLGSRARATARLEAEPGVAPAEVALNAAAPSAPGAAPPAGPTIEAEGLGNQSNKEPPQPVARARRSRARTSRAQSKPHQQLKRGRGEEDDEEGGSKRPRSEDSLGQLRNKPTSLNKLPAKKLKA